MRATSPKTRAAQTVAVVAFDGISPFHLSVPCLVFGQEMGGPHMPRFKLLVCAAEQGPLRTPAGFSVDVVHKLSALARADIVIVPSWHSPNDKNYQAPPETLLKALRAPRLWACVWALLCWPRPAC